MHLLPNKVGVLDSGVGGLSVLNALVPFLPQETVYIADAAHLPYGQKSPAYLVERATILTHFFETLGINTIFVACHTLSATAVPTLQALFPHVTYVDLLPLTVTQALGVTKNNRIGVMATQATINSRVHQKILRNVNPQTTLFEQACPEFVPLIERKAQPEEFTAAIDTYLTPLIKADVDTIILGCTHYPFIQDLLQTRAPHINFISAANALPLFAPGAPRPQITFMTTAAQTYIEEAVTFYFTGSKTCSLTFASIDR